MCWLTGCSIYEHFLFWINLPWKVDVRLRIRNSLFGGNSNVHITERKFLLGRRGTVLFRVCRAFELKTSTDFLNVCVYFSNKSPTRCNSFSVYYPDVYLHLNMFRPFSRPLSGAQWLQWQLLVLPSYHGDSRAVFVVGPVMSTAVTTIRR